MPAIPRRRRPGTLAKNNTVNEIIDYLGGDSSPEMATGQPSDFPPVGKPLIAQVQSRLEAGSNIYICKVLYVSKSTAQALSFGIDVANFPKTIRVHYLGGAVQEGTTVDLSNAGTRNGQPDLAAGTLLEVRPVTRPTSSSDFKTEWISTSTVGGGGSSAKQFKVTTAGLTSVSAKEWDGTTLGTGIFDITTVMGHAIGDIIYAEEISNVIPDPEFPTEKMWLELLKIDPSTSRYAVVQVTDTVGRLAIDYVRAHP